ncbi:response regulator transcription factor [Croceicoccus mobilis]|uniref:DNA-binding response regulator n=1 Tax=Croceicoccus mobilis TaxID=1703339 RepID=A0A916YX32_9SPHN|nr:LuxR C-terminal-related transcriptional regulator [Croceicoccus mobilis]GGD65413.1 DNA-binding response regulator [Croceicoccus mobilis]
MEQRIIIHIVDAEPRNRAAFARIIFDLGHHAEVYESIDELTRHMPDDGIILAHDDPEFGGVLALMDAISQRGAWLPVIAMAANPKMERVVNSMRSGAFDYLEQPVDPEALASTLRRVSKEAENQALYRRRAIEARMRISLLSNREREVLDRLTQGCSNKVIARELEISPRTVEIHRGNMMDKLGARHAAEAVRLRLEASMGDWLH